MRPGLFNLHTVTRRSTGASRQAGFEDLNRLEAGGGEAVVSPDEIRFDQGQLEWKRALRLASQGARVHALIGKLMDGER